MDFCCFLISCQISPSLSYLLPFGVLKPGADFLETKVGAGTGILQLPARDCSSAAPLIDSLVPPSLIHSTLPSLSPSNMHSFAWTFLGICTQRLCCRSFERLVWDMKVVSRLYGDGTRATHPRRVLRVAKPFSADALRRKAERGEGSG